MPHAVVYNGETHAIESRIQGDLTMKDIRELLDEYVRLAKENDCVLILNDYREATVKLSTVEIYGIPRLYADAFASAGIDPYRLRRALVISKDTRDYHFYEIVASNKAQNVRVFTNMDEAREWLFG
jgi:hypothetical protein